jgi:hypothetical protein
MIQLLFGGILKAFYSSIGKNAKKLEAPCPAAAGGSRRPESGVFGGSAV